MLVSDNQYCLVCGKNNPIGFKAKIDIDEVNQGAACTLTIPNEFQGWEGVVHGGIVSTLLDEISASAGMTVAETVVTGELKVRYRKHVPVGREVTVQARVVKKVRIAVFVEAELTLDGEVMASAEAKMVVGR